MLVQIILSFLPYSFITGFTPGPNNILSFNTVSNYGWKDGKRTVGGIVCGFLCVMILCALGCYELARFLPKISGIMKYIGAAYMIWLAVHIALSKPLDETQGQRSSFLTGFLLQFVNVKIILYGITIFTGYVLPSSPSLIFLLAAALFCTLSGTMGTLTWALAGRILQKYIKKYYRAFNITMSLLLVWSAVKLFS